MILYGLGDGAHFSSTSPCSSGAHEVLTGVQIIRRLVMATNIDMRMITPRSLKVWDIQA